MPVILNLPQTVERLRKRLAQLFNDWKSWANNGASIGNGSSGDVLTSDGAGGISWQAGGGGGGSGGITVSQGSSDGQGPILATNTPAEISLPRAVAFATGWQMQYKPPGSITVDLRSDAFPTIPDGSDSITGSNQPVISSALSNSGNLSTWTATSLAAGVNLQVVVTANTGVRWFSLTVY